MAEPLKTQPTVASVDAFLAAVEPPVRQSDARVLLDMMQAISGHKPVLWGPSIIGFGSYCYTYKSGQTGTWSRIGFSPRKANLVVYLLDGYDARAEQLSRLGKHKIGKACLYITKLTDIDHAVLAEMISASWAEMGRRYPTAETVP